MGFIRILPAVAVALMSAGCSGATDDPDTLVILLTAYSSVDTAVDRLAGPCPHVLADGPGELPVLLELPVEPG